MADLFGTSLVEKIEHRFREALAGASGLTDDQKVDLFNRIQDSMFTLIRHLCPDPACCPQLLRSDKIHGNDYNPNKVASTEMDLLEQSMREDGITMSIVVMKESASSAVVIDGFHRRTVATERLGRKWVPCSVIDRPLGDRMASTVRHNRARGKHQVDLMGSLIKGMMDLGWDDDKIASSLGMSPEEFLRLRQMVGAASVMAGEYYTRSWAVDKASDKESE